MYVNVNEAEEKLYEMIQLLVDGKEESIIIVKNGKPVAKISPISNKNPKRIGVAKKEMSGFDISMEDFDSIPIDDFGIWRTSLHR